MRIAILNLTGGGFSGGYKRYVSSTLSRLALAPEITEILCASPSSLGVESWLEGTPKIQFAQCESFKFMRHTPDPGLKAVLDSFHPDLIFIPLERYVKYREVPVVTVLHNMGPLSDTKVSSGIIEKAKCLAQYLETRIAIKNSSAVIAPTNHVRDFLINTWSIQPSRVTTINFGVSPLPGVVNPPSDLPTGTRFIFTAGAIEVYRGLEDLVRALPKIKGSIPELKLLVAGGARPATLGYLTDLKKLAERLKVADDIVWLGNIREQELSWCYRNCSAFVMTSRVESFGFVALEALQHGCGCVSSDSPCLPEIFRGCALYYKPGDIAALAGAADKVLRRDAVDRTYYSDIAARAISGFSWETSVRKTLEVFISVVAKGTKGQAGNSQRVC